MPTSRRDFVKKALSAASMSSPLARSLRGSASSPPPDVGQSSPDRSPQQALKTQQAVKVFMEPFEYDGVRLLDGRMKSQYLAARDYFLAIPSDDMLRGFRMRAGLSAPGNDLGGWYSGDPHVRTWWSGGDTFSVFGQWL